MNDDIRIGDIIVPLSGRHLADHVKANSVVIIGFPYDEGVRRNGGRLTILSMTSIYDDRPSH